MQLSRDFAIGNADHVGGTLKAGPDRFVLSVEIRCLLASSTLSGADDLLHRKNNVNKLKATQLNTKLSGEGDLSNIKKIRAICYQFQSKRSGVKPPGGIGNFNDIKIKTDILYADGSVGVNGTIVIAPVQFGSYTIKQAFLNATSRWCILMNTQKTYLVVFSPESNTAFAIECLRRTTVRDLALGLKSSLVLTVTLFKRLKKGVFGDKIISE
ncbi:hypothetical protein BDQ17DRAFT_1413952 [Cyathus striatus]|nr:hypothetical protein BDQ17DRAFT_1413952 [Cyathus striatus]